MRPLPSPEAADTMSQSAPFRTPGLAARMVQKAPFRPAARGSKKRQSAPFRSPGMRAHFAVVKGLDRDQWTVAGEGASGVAQYEGRKHVRAWLVDIEPTAEKGVDLRAQGSGPIEAWTLGESV